MLRDTCYYYLPFYGGHNRGKPKFKDLPKIPESINKQETHTPFCTHYSLPIDSFIVKCLLALFSFNPHDIKMGAWNMLTSEQLTEPQSFRMESKQHLILIREDGRSVVKEIPVPNRPAQGRRDAMALTDQPAGLSRG